MVADLRLGHPRATAAPWCLAGLLGMVTETLRLWVHRGEVDAGERPGTTSGTLRSQRLTREVPELPRANKTLKAASVLLRQGARPPYDEVIC